MSEHHLLTDAQAAEVLHCQPRTVRLWRRTRGLPFVRLSHKTVRIPRADLDEWVLRHRVGRTK